MLTPVTIMAGSLTIILMIFLVARWNNRKSALVSVQERKGAID
jgi:hypothetical protein